MFPCFTLIVWVALKNGCFNTAHCTLVDKYNVLDRLHGTVCTYLCAQFGRGSLVQYIVDFIVLGEINDLFLFLYNTYTD